MFSYAADINFKDLQLELPKDRSGLAWAEFNGDKLADLLVADDSVFTVYFQMPEKTYSDDNKQIISVPGGAALYDLSDLNGDGISEIVLLSAESVTAYAWDANKRAIILSEKPLLEGIRGIEPQHLAPADFMFDIDRDGDEDLVIPMDGKYYIYFQASGEFTKKNQLSSKPVRVRMSLGNAENPRSSIETSLTIPRLAFTDLNGDGRLDLRSSTDNRESFYLQGANGEIPETPAYEADLKRFKDQIPKSNEDIKIDQFQFIPADLNSDKREDYAVVAGNKIWVFIATEQGVNFEKPDQIIKVSADHMSVVLLELNDDGRPDLLIVKFALPSLGRLVAGLAVGLRFEGEFLQYDNVKDTVFSRSPNDRATMIFKIPPILKLLGELDDLAKQFKDIEKRSKSIAGGDFNGDSRKDVVRIEGGNLELFLADAAVEVKTDYDKDQGDAKFYKRVLFGEKRRDVSLDTLMNFFSNTVTEFMDEAVAGRKPSSQMALPGDWAARVRQIICRDMNADGKDDIALLLAPPLDSEGREDEDIETQTMAMWISR